MRLVAAFSFLLLAPIIQASPLSASGSNKPKLIGRATVTVPSQDPFYTAPSGFQSTALGTILKRRQIDTSWLGFIPTLNVTAYQLLYRTESHNGTAMATVTTVFVPAVIANNPPNLIAFNTAEDSVSSICAPSYAYQTGSVQISTIVSFEYLILSGFLNQGWIVVSADYEGPDSAFGAGRLEGKGVLDSIRAALNFGTLGLTSASKIGITGYSGGAIAAGWAGALQPTYAPELNIAGISHGGTPANISGTLQFLDGTLFAGFAVGGIQGIRNAYSDINILVGSLQTLWGRTGFALASSVCSIAMIADFALQTVESSLWTSAGSGLLHLPAVQTVTTQNTLGVVAAETPGAPTYVYHALHDEVIPIADIETTITAWCANGANLVYERNVGVAEHVTQEIFSVGRVIHWFIDRFNGVALSSGCTIRNVTTSQLLADPQVAGTGMAAVWDQLQTYE